MRVGVIVAAETARAERARRCLNGDEPSALLVPAQAERAVLQVEHATDVLDDQVCASAAQSTVMRLQDEIIMFTVI